MIASVQIAGAAHALPDAISFSTEGSDPSTSANFQSVLWQVHSSPEQEFTQDGTRGNDQPNQKDSTSAWSLPAPQNIDVAKADLTAALLPVQEPAQAATAVPEAHGTSTFAKPQGAPGDARSPRSQDSETDTITGTGQKDTDSGRTNTVLAKQTAETPRVIPLFTATARQDGSGASQSANFTGAPRRYRSSPSQESGKGIDPNNSEVVQKNSTSALLVSLPQGVKSSKASPTSIALPVQEQEPTSSAITDPSGASTYAKLQSPPRDRSAHGQDSALNAAPGTSQRQTGTSPTGVPLGTTTVEPARAVLPLTASAEPSQGGSDASTPASFQSVLRQVYSVPEQESTKNLAQDDIQPKQKDSATVQGADGVNFESAIHNNRSARGRDSQTVAMPLTGQKGADSAGTVVVPSTQTAETPRWIPRFTASNKLQQEGTPSQSTAADSEAAKQVSSNGSHASSPSSVRSILSGQNSGDDNSTLDSSQPSQKNSNFARPVMALPDAAAAQVGPTSALTPVPGQVQEQAQVSPEVPERSGASTDVNSQGALRKDRSASGQDSEADAAPVSGQKDADPTRTGALLATQTVETQRQTLPVVASATLRQDGTTSPSSFAAAQVADAETAHAAAPPQLQTDGTGSSPSGSLAFAARLSPNALPQAPGADELPAAEQPSREQTTPQTTFQTSAQATAQTAPKQAAGAANEPADARGGEGGDPSPKQNAGDLVAKPDTLLAQSAGLSTAHAAAPAGDDAVRNRVGNDTPATPPSAVARMDKVIDPPPAQTSTNHDITVRIPDATEQGTAVRFVERGGEVHVSVRTGDAEMAQTLRGGLTDLVNRLQDGGIRTEVWQPGSDASSSQDDLHQSFADPDGSHGNPSSSGSHSEQESSQQNKPRWVEELEESIGNENIKETP